MTGREVAKILVVDDNEAGRYLKSHALKGRGYALLEAATGKGGLALLEAELPDLVLLDVKLSDMSGLEVCRQIKLDHPGIVVLQTSAAFVRPADRASALAGGANSYLIEPIEPEELVAAVGALLRMRYAERQLREVNQELKRRVRDRTRELNEAKDRLAAEMEHRAKAEEALRHAQKLDAIGRLTGGIAHDFNNLLTVVLGNLSLMEMNLRKPLPLAVDKLMKLVGSGRKAVQDCERLTRQLLAFARRDPLRAETVDLTLTLAEFEGFLRGILGEKVELEVQLASGLWSLQIDAGQLETTILNLAINARDAMPEWGRLQIESANLPIGAAAAPCQRRYLQAGGDPCRGVCPGERPRYRGGHVPRYHGAGLRALLHHQGRRQGQRPRPQPSPRLRQAIRRIHRHHQHPGPGHRGRALFPPLQGRRGRCDGRP